MIYQVTIVQDSGTVKMRFLESTALMRFIEAVVRHCPDGTEVKTTVEQVIKTEKRDDNVVPF